MRDKRIQNKMRLRFSTLVVLLLLIFLMTACTFTQSSFARTANSAGSSFAAAEATLSYAHNGKITNAYAAASFVNFQSELSGIDQTLTAQGGFLDAGTVATSGAAELGGISIAISLCTGISWHILFPFVALFVCILLMAFLVALISLPLTIITGGG